MRADRRPEGIARLKEPIACTEAERREFARLVRQGFAPVTEPLDGRIRDAACLAFHYAAGDALGAVAALKAPDERYRHDLFEKADARISAADCRLELGWVFVVPAHRGNRIAERLCRLLLARVPGSSVFATTRTNNHAMIRILLALGFTRVGQPYPRRDEALALYLRSLDPVKEETPRSVGV
jgi:ribosomal protein S18 acetylase RimI-like enzyme